MKKRWKIKAPRAGLLKSKETLARSQLNDSYTALLMISMRLVSLIESSVCAFICEKESSCFFRNDRERADEMNVSGFYYQFPFLFSNKIILQEIQNSNK